MHVGIFTNAYLPIVNGVVNSVESIRLGLTKLGHHIYIITSHYPNYTETNLDVFRYPSIRLTSAADFPLPIPYHKNMTDRINKIPFDVIHSQHPFLLGVLGEKIARVKSIPLVFTFHTQYEQYVHYAPLPISKRILRWGVKKMVSSYVKKCDAIVAPSPSIQETVVEYGGGDRCHVISNAIPIEHFEQIDGSSVIKKYQLSGKKVSVFVGRLAQEKNLAFLLDAFLLLISKVPEAMLLLVGDGPYRHALQNEVRAKHLDRHVIFTGMIPPTEVARYYSAAHLFVMTSTTEVKPLALLEAMAAGLPILAVRAPGPIDTVTHGQDGYLTNENIKEYADAWTSLLTNHEQLTQMSIEARKKAKSFGVATMAQSLENLYQELLKR